jgi:hypothetical protein
MNSYTHEEYAKATARLILSDGFAPAAKRFLLEGHPQFTDSAALPDLVHEVALVVPGRPPFTELLRHGLSSFQHFQIYQRGYRWQDDPSLALGGTAETIAKVIGALAPLPGLGILIGAVADPQAATGALARVAGLRLTISESDPRPPFTGLSGATPMRDALAQQPGFPIGSFYFPSAASGCAFYARAAVHWASVGDLVNWRICAGYVMHLLQDCCAPHHVWGVLLFGHAEWEDAMQAAWHEVLAEVLADRSFGEHIGKAVRNELQFLTGITSVAELCEVNAAWTATRFGSAQELSECPGNVALRVSVRAVAASVRACEMMAQ